MCARSKWEAVLLGTRAFTLLYHIQWCWKPHTNREEGGEGGREGGGGRGGGRGEGGRGGGGEGGREGGRERGREGEGTHSNGQLFESSGQPFFTCSLECTVTHTGMLFCGGETPLHHDWSIHVHKLAVSTT